jgi:hypothetical protein
LTFQVSVGDYVVAARQRQRGNSTANPLSQAMGGQTYFALSSYRRGEFVAVDRRTGTCYFGSPSPGLAACMAGFERGEPIVVCHSFELAFSTAN